MPRQSLTAASRELAGRSEAMARLVGEHGHARFGRQPRVDERFAWLARSVAYQQLAGSAAAAIWSRVETTVGEVTPERLSATSPDALRAAGMSNAKIASLHDMAAKVASGDVDLRRVARLADDAVIDHLTVIRGVGPWTAQMFLMFPLRRLDVWPVLDLGVRKGFAIGHDLDSQPTADELEPLGDPYRPYRSVVAWYCWRAAATRLP